MSRLLTLAVRELNRFPTLPVKGNERFSEYALQSAVNRQGDTCGYSVVFVQWLCTQLKLPRGGADQRSWLDQGRAVKSPMPGDIAVINTKGGCDGPVHLAVFVELSEKKDRAYCIGAFDNPLLSLGAYYHENVLGYRRLENESVDCVPSKRMRLGSIGDEVMKLQALLAERDCASSDPPGIFGFATETALKNFQTREGLPVDGIYGDMSFRVLARDAFVGIL